METEIRQVGLMRGVPSFSHLTGLVAFMDVQWNFLPGHVNGPSNGPYLRLRGGSTAPRGLGRSSLNERLVCLVSVTPVEPGGCGVVTLRFLAYQRPVRRRQSSPGSGFVREGRGVRFGIANIRMSRV